MQVPVQPLVAVEEAKNIAPRPEENVLGQPREVHALAALAPRPVIDALLEGMERPGDLQDDPAAVEVAQRREVRLGAIAQWLDYHVVVALRQAGESPARLGGGHVRQLAIDHVRRAAYSFGSSLIETELMQYGSPVGAGRSSKAWP